MNEKVECKRCGKIVDKKIVSTLRSHNVHQEICDVCRTQVRKHRIERI